MSVSRMFESPGGGLHADAISELGGLLWSPGVYAEEASVL